MTDLIHHILSNDLDVTTIVGTKVFYSYRQQGTAVPAIVMEYNSTDAEYVQGGNRKASTYTFEVVCMSNSLGQTHSIAQAVIAALENNTGEHTTPEGNTYDVTASYVTDQDFYTPVDGRIHEAAVTVEMTIRH